VTRSSASSARSWYHAIELPDGSVTPGWFDLRGQVHHYGLPDDLSGKRCLDVGTWDGFWAFELERRGASEVVAIDLDHERDLDWPPRRRPADPAGGRGDGFREARARLGSAVERVELSVYDATPERLGSFDLVFCGSVLIHLRDQLLALERIASVTRGTFVSAEEYERTPFPWAMARFRADNPAAVVFWRPNRRGWRRMLWTAGFDRVVEHGRFVLRGDRVAVPHVVHHAHRS
jgi:tRNA (mo5U34)-methyltransferase